MRHVVVTMGTVLSLASDADPATIARLDAVFAEFDELFSLYRAESELSRVRDGRLSLMDASTTVRDTYARALAWRDSTAGAFTPHRPDGAVDLDGIVKAEAMARAGEILGDGDWCLNVGGDVLVAGQADTGPWSVGIVDPADRDRLLTAVPLVGSRRAAATSGSAERGDHIWTRGRVPSVFAQVTVLADEIVAADVLATAIVSGGPETLDLVAERFDVDVLTVAHDGSLTATPGMAIQVRGDRRHP
ncbi:MAG TPA: FAD:protein FMN transferase [Pseudolysinimonas sp.]